jgi:hypothetical protein
MLVVQVFCYLLFGTLIWRTATAPNIPAAFSLITLALLIMVPTAWFYLWALVPSVDSPL